LKLASSDSRFVPEAAQLLAERRVGRGRVVVSAFRLYGRGQSWNTTSSARDANVWEEDRVMMTADEVNFMGQGRVTYVDAQPDGSGARTIDLSDAYGGTTGRLYTMYGNFRNASDFQDLGIRATRAMAVDYSGQCGAPAIGQWEELQAIAGEMQALGVLMNKLLRILWALWKQRSFYDPTWGWPAA
jgi:hypothetical protein